MRISGIAQLVLISLLLGPVGSKAAPGAPHQMNFQGQLLDAGGTPLPDGPKGIRVVIWNDPTATAPANEVWNSGPLTVTTTGGLFTVMLGEPPQPVLDPSVMLDSSRWVGVTVGADPEMMPRTRFSSVPYAWTSQHAITSGSTPWSGLTGTPEGFADGIDDTALTPAAGIATAGFTSETVIPATTMSDVVTVTITTPSAGYVTVDGKGYGAVGGAAGAWNMGWVQIDETAGGAEDYPHAVAFGFQNAPNADFFLFPFYVTRTFAEPAGTYTFRLEAARNSTNSGGTTVVVGLPTIRAVFVPLAYGSVTAVATQDQSTGGGMQHSVTQALRR